MDAIIPSLPNLAPVSRRDISYYILVFLALAAILGAMFWYADQNQQTSQVSFLPDQFIPQPDSGTFGIQPAKALSFFQAGKHRADS